MLTGLRQIHYVILLPPLEVCLERVQLRVDHGFSDLLVTRDLYEQFANAVVETRHLITEPGDHPAELAELISRATGRRPVSLFRLLIKCVLSLSKGGELSQCALSLSKAIYRNVP